MNIKNMSVRALLILCCASIACTAQAAELTGTLKKIKDDKTIVLGYRESSIPWSYVDSSTNKVVGYSYETALQIVDAIKRELGMPDLQVRQIPITAQNRIPLMLNGTIDLECNGTTNTAERRRQVAFSNTIAITQTQLLTKKTSGVRRMSDLAGKSVVVTAGSTSERYMRTFVQQKGMDTNVISSKDHSQAFLMLQSDRVAAFFMDRDVLSALLSKARDAADYALVGEPQTREALACMLRKDDPQFKALIDKTIAGMQTSGKSEKLYNRWFMNPIPPKGDVLNTPLHESMRELFAHPNDRAFEE
jgi:glutamate/aspartate transport system substrate-binding protein